MRIRILPIIFLIIFGVVQCAYSETVSDLYGDIDGFGIGISENDSFSISQVPTVRTEGETDYLTNALSHPVTWNHSIALPDNVIVNHISLEIFSGGQGLGHIPSSVWINDSFLGYLTDGEINGVNFARKDIFSISNSFTDELAELTIKVITNAPNNGFDNWVMDYSLVSVDYTQNTATVPEPSSMMLLFLGCLMLSFINRRPALKLE